eukprot:Amastigsp_a510271_99.p3 type:complete len:202 gc:universal Amastigsp_a510271_99:1377-772(-)
MSGHGRDRKMCRLDDRECCFGLPHICRLELPAPVDTPRGARHSLDKVVLARALAESPQHSLQIAQPVRLDHAHHDTAVDLERHLTHVFVADCRVLELAALDSKPLGRHGAEKILELPVGRRPCAKCAATGAVEGRRTPRRVERDSHRVEYRCQPKPREQLREHLARRQHKVNIGQRRSVRLVCRRELAARGLELLVGTHHD